MEGCIHQHRTCDKCLLADARARIVELEETLRRTLSGHEPTDDMDILRDWRDSVVARAAAAGMPRGVGLCEWFEGLAAEHQSSP